MLICTKIRIQFICFSSQTRRYTQTGPDPRLYSVESLFSPFGFHFEILKIHWCALNSTNQWDIEYRVNLLTKIAAHIFYSLEQISNKLCALCVRVYPNKQFQ